MNKKLVIYQMAGESTPALCEAAVEGGADVIELGFPFSDPLAEGPVIRQAAERALRAGMTTDRCLECLAQVSGRVNVPVIPMTYAAILEAYGHERFLAEAASAGAASLILVDVPADEHPDVRRIQLVAPTSTDERIRLAAERTDGWLYVVSVTGTTGTRDSLSGQLTALVKRARALAPATALYAGFGISTPELAREAVALVDGVIVGTRAVELSAAGPAKLHAFVRGLRSAIDRQS